MNKCNVEGCNREIKAKQLCDMHLQRLYRTGSTGKANLVCNAAGCDDMGVRMGKGMHRNTYMRLLGQSHIMLLGVSQAMSKHYKSH